MTTKVAAPSARTSFSRLKHVLDLPNLIDIQKASFQWFLDEGLRETIDDISPIEDYTGTLAVEFGAYKFGEPQFSIKECREKDLTYQAPLSMTVRFVNKETGEIREQTVFMGDFPMMTEWGTFIINGTERVIVTQLVRSPGAYLMEPKDATKQVFTANLMPSRGSWLELEIDKKGIVYARIDRKRKLPITTLLRALPGRRTRRPASSWTRRRTRRSSSSSTTRSSSSTRSRRTPPRERRRPSSRCSRSSGPASRRRSTTRGTCSRRCSSIPSATT